MPIDWKAGAGRVLPVGADPATAVPRGAGFLVSDRGLVVSCAHVVLACLPNEPVGTPSKVLVVFDRSGEAREAEVDWDQWRALEQGDVAFLRMVGDAPPGAEVLPLGPAAAATDHRFQTTGYPAGSMNAELGSGTVLGIITQASGVKLLQLESTQVTTGFSGGPIWDEQAGHVIGMVSGIVAPDAHGRGGETAFATPSETLIEVCPELRLSEECPYRGLEPYGMDDARLFFGRQELIDRLLAKVREEPSILAVFGPSGSGKSSLIQAGLIPQLLGGSGQQRWSAAAVRHYGDVDVENALSSVRTYGTSDPPQRLLLVFDQFEELLVTRPRPVSQTVMARLAELPGTSARVTIVLVMRDDFYSAFTAAAPETLRDGVLPNLIQIPATLARAELNAMVTGPADVVGLRFAPGLAERIVNDTIAAAPDMEGVSRSTVLPLLEFSLTELWRRRRDGLLTHEDYDEIGEVTGGLAAWANRSLLEMNREGEDLRPLARRVMLNLVQFGDSRRGVPDSRRSRPVSELARGEDLEAVQRVVKLLIDSRLVVPSGGGDGASDGIELVHDALIREWGELRGWIRQSRIFRLWLQGVGDRSRRWVETAPADPAGRDAGLLLRGGELAEAATWLEDRREELDEDQEEYIAQSIALRQRDAQNTIDHERRLRRFLIGTALAAVLFFLSAIVAVFLFQRAEHLSDLNLMHSLAVQAQLQERRGADEPSALLARQAYLLDEDGEVQGPIGTALHASVGSPFFSTYSPVHASAVRHLAASGDGRMMATVRNDGSLQVWDGASAIPCEDADGRPLRSIVAVFTSDGTMLASGSGDGTVHLWSLDQEGCRHVDALPGPGGAIFAVAFSEGGADTWLVAGSCATGQDASPAAFIRALGCADGGATVRLWALGHDDERPEDRPIDGTVACALAASADGQWLAASGCGDVDPDEQRCGPATGQIVLWDLGDPDDDGRCVAAHAGDVNALAFDGCANVLASGGVDRTIRLWNPEGGTPLMVLSGQAEAITSVSFSRDCDFIASGSQDGSVGFWHLPDEEPVITILGTSTQWVRTVSFGGEDGRELSTESSNRRIRTWNLGPVAMPAPGVLRGHESYVRSLAFSPVEGHRRLASAAEDGTVRIWNLDRPGADPVLPGFGESAPPEIVAAVSFSHDGSLLAASDNRGRVWIWDRDALDTPLDQVSVSSGGEVPLAFHPTGNQLVAGTRVGELHVWDADAGEAWGAPLDLDMESRAAVTTLTFNLDGTRLAVGNASGEISIWRWTDAGLDSAPMHAMSHDDPTDQLASGPVRSLAFSPDGELLASGGNDGAVRVWDASDTFRLVETLTGHTDEIRSLVFSRDGAALITGSTDQTLRIWLTERFEDPPVVITDVNEWIRAVAMSPDGTVLAAAATQGGIRLIVPDSGDLADLVCERVSRNLSSQEWSVFVGDATDRERTCPAFE